VYASNRLCHSPRKRAGSHDLPQKHSGGLAAVFSFAVLFLLGIVIYLVVWAAKEQGEGSIGWDPISLIRPGPMLIVLAVFVAGFLWEFRRASK
jgi:hypothetical protein